MSEVYKKLPSRVAGFVPRGDDPEQFNEDKVVSKHVRLQASCKDVVYIFLYWLIFKGYIAF
jgi:hypothetical protein